MARCLLVAVLSAAGLQAASGTWLDSVAPIMTATEKKTYLSLTPAERTRFEESFWADKTITAAEYFERLQYVDANFGSTKTASGVNTDQGRVYLSLGPPTKVARVASCRIFVPIEIWYYDAVPAIHLNTELRLIFFRKNGIGLPRLYSQEMDTIRALLLPQPATTKMFGPNDAITESGIRNKLNVSPAEGEIVTAAVNVATGIRDVGNDEILGQVSSPSAMLVIVSRPRLDVLQTVSSYGGSQVDLSLETPLLHELDILVAEGPVTVYQNQLHLKFDQTQNIRYTHRLDLLPGVYRIIFKIDGAEHPYGVKVPERTSMGEIWRANAGEVG